jgi:hypothetical protein
MPEALVLAAACHLTGIEAIGVAFLALYGPYQFGFVHPATSDAPFPGDYSDLGHIHRHSPT